MAQNIEKLIAETFLEMANGLESGSYGKRPKIALTGMGSEHGEENSMAAAVMAAKEGIDVYYIGTLEAEGVTTVKVADDEEGHKKMEELLEKGEVDVLCHRMLLCLDRETQILTARGFLGPEELQKTFKELMHSPIGAFGICVAGPILEELLMRTAILGLMLRGGVKPWIAIVISALAFGLMHMNMAQFVFAGIGGLILGLVYYKTNNIFSVMIIHIIQNTFATVMTLSMERIGYEDKHLYDLIGLPTVVVLLIVFASGSIYLLKRLCSQFPQPQFVENVEADEQVMEEC